MYFEDLSSYSYWRLPRPLHTVRNAGWLEEAHRYQLGEVSAEFLANLARLINGQGKAQQTRGFHQCPFCKVNPIRERYAGIEFVLGSSEVWVPVLTAENIYAAPNLIWHYAQTHSYLPPAGFIESVMSFDFSSSWNASEISERMIDEAFKADD